MEKNWIPLINILVTTKNNVLTDNGIIRADGFATILFKNIGTDVVYINDNIPIAAGSSFVFDNQPYVVIDESFSVKFAGVEISKKLLVIKSYFKLNR